VTHTYLNIEKERDAERQTDRK